ncbi:metalloprotease TIKI1-like [Babylonia areolata]|uniref:metalloprotease TIKI1-like n=1 Tax=Babylonia areolata TaxID=304850 RepID=UPI003FD5410C
MSGEETRLQLLLLLITMSHQFRRLVFSAFVLCSCLSSAVPRVAVDSGGGGGGSGARGKGGGGGGGPVSRGAAAGGRKQRGGGGGGVQVPRPARPAASSAGVAGADAAGAHHHHQQHQQQRSDNDRDAPCETPSDPADLNSFLWTIRRDPPSYLFGTIHVPYTQVWDFIPDNAKQAFRQTDYVFFELDLTDPYTLSALASCQLLPKGENLANVLPAGLYSRLKRHLEYVRGMMPGWMTRDQRNKGLYADYLFNAIAGNWERKRPVWVMLMVNTLTESDIKSRGIPVLDLHLAQEAERLGKLTGAVERVEEQCLPLNDLNFSQVVFALNQTLVQHEVTRAGRERSPFTTVDLIRNYNCGDLNSIMITSNTRQVPYLLNSSMPPAEAVTARRIDDYFQQELIDKRNERMAQRVNALLTRFPNKSFFFAFGAGHFLGRGTVVDRLRRLGLELDHTGPTEPIPQVQEGKKKSQRRRKPGSTLSSGFPLPSDVIYGDIQYLFKKKIRHSKRRGRKKGLFRVRKRHRRLEALWSSLEGEGDKRRSRQKSRRKKGKHKSKQKTFNDLWVRMDNSRPRFLQQKSEDGVSASSLASSGKQHFIRLVGSVGSRTSTSARDDLTLTLSTSSAACAPCGSAAVDRWIVRLVSVIVCCLLVMLAGHS